MDHIKEQKFYKRKVIFLVVAISIILLLVIFLFTMGRNTSCDTCSIEFTNYEVSGMKIDNPITYDVPVNYLYENLSEGECVIKFDKVGGYHL